MQKRFLLRILRNEIYEKNAMGQNFKPTNPFLVAGYSGPDYFCDRVLETSKIVEALTNGRNLTLIAPRKMGKTGLIKHVFNALESKDSVCMYMDIFPTSCLGDFVKVFASAVLGHLDSASQRALKRIGQFIKSCCPVFTVDEKSGVPKVTVEVADSNQESTLEEIFEYLRSSEKRCYIAIDEFQQISEYPEKGIEALLRSYVQFSPNVNFIFAGSRQHLMQEMFLSSKKPFYHSTQILNLDRIDRQEYYRFAETFFNKKGISFPEAGFDGIYDRYEGHIWYIQSVLNRLYSYSRDVDSNLIEYALSQIISEFSYSYETLLKALPAGSVRLLRAIATEGKVKNITSGEFISKYRLRAASSISSSLKKLLDNELVYNTPNGYIVYDRFMGEWLSQFDF